MRLIHFETSICSLWTLRSSLAEIPLEEDQLLQLLCYLEYQEKALMSEPNDHFWLKKDIYHFS